MHTSQRLTQLSTTLVQTTAAAWLFVACSPAASLPLSPVPASAGAIEAPMASSRGPIIYVSDFLRGTVDVYRQHGHNQQPIAKINGLDASLGLFVDRRRHLYISQGDSVLEFAPGSDAPVKTYHDDGHIAQGVTRCPNGTLYVTNVDGNTISAFEGGSTEPTKTLHDNGVQVFAIACDRTNDIFVTVAGEKYQVDEFPGGSSDAINLPIQLVFPEGIAVDDSGDIVVANGSGGAVEFFHPGDAAPFRSIPMAQGSLQLSFDHRDSTLWVSTGSDVERYSVKTGKLTDILSIEAGGLATSPAD